MTDTIFPGWEFEREKSGGAQGDEGYTAVYRNLKTPDILALIKKEKNLSSNISEFLGSQIFQAVSPESGAKVSLIAPFGTELRKDDSAIYVVSEFVKNYIGDMYVDMDRHMSPKTRPSRLLRKNGRPMFMGTRNKWAKTLDKSFKQRRYRGFDDIMPASLLIGDFDVHLANAGVVKDDDHPHPRLVRIDFAGSLNKLENEIHPHSHTRHPPGLGPTNHFREFPRKLRISDEFADQLLAASKFNLDETIDKSFAKLSKYYSDAALINWAKRTMPGRVNDLNTTDDVTKCFKEIMKKRQESLQEFALQIKLGHLITKQKTAPYYKFTNKPRLRELVREYPDFFRKATNIKLRDRTLGKIFLEKNGNKIYIRHKKSILHKIALFISEALDIKLADKKKRVFVDIADNKQNIRLELPLARNKHNIGPELPQEVINELKKVQLSQQTMVPTQQTKAVEAVNPLVRAKTRPPFRSGG